MSPVREKLPKPTALRLKSPPGEPHPVRCTVGLLTWNGGQDAVRCVRSLLAQSEPGLELIWIDNASTDGTPQRLWKAFPELGEPTVNPHNVGFCVGHNQGLAACRTPYYLALNQDAVLGETYIERLCDWMDEHDELALVSGLILQETGSDEVKARIYSAGMAWPRTRFAFELAMGRPVHPELEGRRLVPAVDGSAMLLRTGAARLAVLEPHEVFPEDLFAYAEEVDLAMRLTYLGLQCGVDGTARAWHRGRGSKGFDLSGIRSRFFANHWLLTLRHDDGATIVREMPWIVWGELRHWLPEYASAPVAFVRALGRLVKQCRRARRHRRAWIQRHGLIQERPRRFRAESARQLRWIEALYRRA